MLIIHCPYCEMPRPEIEFRHAGEAHIVRPEDPSAVSDEAWAEYLYHRTNSKGVVIERWRHVHGCGRFFNCVRHSVTDRIVMTYKAGQPRPSPADIEAAVKTAVLPGANR
jgi:sarcosine oxidase, subunit delta